MQTRLEEAFVGKIVVPRGRRDVVVWDSDAPGLFVRKFSTGRIMFGVRYSVAGKPRQMHLLDGGEKGALAKARKMAGDVRAMARLGKDVLKEREDAKAAARAAAARKIETLGNVATRYLKARKTELRPRSYIEVERHINKAWRSLHPKALADITRADLVEVLDGLEAKSGKVAADRALSSLGTLYGWAIDRGIVSATPVTHFKRRAGNLDRERTLSKGEIAEVWRAANARGDAYGRIVALLILTGQRKGEVGGLEWTELQTDRIDLPGDRTKNKRPHQVPLSKPALAQIPAKPDQPDAPTTVFGRRAHSSFSGWSKAKGELDASIAEARRKSGIKRDMAPWRVHDIRRTVATMLGELGFAAPHVVEAILNHTSGVRAGVAGTYNRALYWDERVEALRKWGAWVAAL
jgi:integrase